ncbi:hypothetical protein B566_EDAN007580 [Ephemera danica]|nr:hypothetical protein B566_EDAN007580 [Ephemera danica]
MRIYAAKAGRKEHLIDFILLSLSGGVDCGQVDSEELEEHFKESVNFVSIQFPMFKSTKKSRGFAFIQMASKEDYKIAQTLNDTVLKGKQIVVERIQAKRKISDDEESKQISDVPNKKIKKSDSNDNVSGKNKAASSEKKSKYSLFIGMLPFDTTKEELEEHIQKSNVNFVSIRMPAYESTNKPRGFAFIDFSSEEDYKAALALNKSVLKGRQISVEYTCAGSKKSKKRSSKIKAKTLKFKGLQEIGIMPKRANKKSKTHSNSKHTVVFKGKTAPKN